MSAPGPNRLVEVLEGLQVRLEGELRGSRTAVTHPGARGHASEEDWLRVLRGHLPHRYQADRAFVIDSKGECSDQIDVVIYDRQYSPLLYNQSGEHYVPAESVYAILEVKQNLCLEHVRYAGDKAASVRRLLRTSAPVPHVEGIARPRVLPRVVAGIVTYESSWSPPLGEPLRQALAGLSAEHQLDIGCALIHGTFESRYPADSALELDVDHGPRPLLRFFLQLLRQLQSLGTVPAIDFERYLTSFRSDGQD